MTEQNTSSELSEQQREQRKELFRYANLDHSVMQVLFNLPLDLTKQSTTEHK